MHVSMALRYSRILKLFAILLFLLEFLAPAAMAANQAEPCDKSATHLVDGDHGQNFIYSLFREELTENEESKEDQKNPIVLFDLNIVSSFFQVNDLLPSRYQSFLISAIKFDTEPPLFKLHCIYLI